MGLDVVVKRQQIAILTLNGTDGMTLQIDDFGVDLVRLVSSETLVRS